MLWSRLFHIYISKDLHESDILSIFSTLFTCAVRLFSTTSVSMQRYGEMRIEIVIPLERANKAK